MHHSLTTILEIQELDIKMIRLMRIKKQRQNELEEIESLTVELQEQKTLKEEEIQGLDHKVNSIEEEITSQSSKIKALEEKQTNIKKVDEFNALTQEMTAVERQKIALEQEASNLLDKKSAEEEILEKIKESLATTEESSQTLKDEIFSSIGMINEEGAGLKVKRDALIGSCEKEILVVYERLLRNKKDRVIVPVENRTCSGCHVGITIQQENLVRKGEGIVHCEHCSRILYWPESELAEAAMPSTTSRRRRRTAAQ